MRSWLRAISLFVCVAACLTAQTVCDPVPAYTPCDITFELTEQEAGQHPNPYMSVDITAELRSPQHQTFLVRAFWDGGRKMVLRFAPTEQGAWDFRLSGNIARFQGKLGEVTATERQSKGFIRTANVHHFQYTEELAPHLWMGDTMYRMATVDEALFRQIVDKRAEQKFNHIRGLILGWEEDASKVFPTPESINVAHFQSLDRRLAYMNSKGIVADLVLACDSDHLVKLFPNWQDRERYMNYLLSRYAAYNITWQGVQEFEEYENGRAVLKEINEIIKKNDPYRHPRSTHAVRTSSPLLEDGWMDYVVYQSSENELGLIEHLLYPRPQVNSEFGYENSGAGKSHDHHVDTDTFRKRLWNASMNGQYVTYGNTGTYGGRKFQVDAKYADAPGAAQMTVWHDFMSRTRYWDLQPYFEVSNGRALALESIEYIVYLEKPGPVEVRVEKHGYDVFWFNPITGELVKEKKEYKGELFAGAPPDNSHDWVLHLSREGRKEGMLKSYKFEARRVLLQEVETKSDKLPFEIEAPKGNDVPAAGTTGYSVKLTRETKATASMMYLWMAEVATEGKGSRVLGTGPSGEWKIPRGIATKFPAVMHVRVYGLNGYGKLYSIDRIFTIKE